MRIWLSLITALFLTTACGESPSVVESAGEQAPQRGDVAASVAMLPGENTAQMSVSQGMLAGIAGMDGRSGLLINPASDTVVFLYYDLAGISPPIDRWAQDDNRITTVPAGERAALREAVKAELEAGMASVAEVGLLRLSINTLISDYDPTYGEFTIMALSPSSIINFQAFGQKVGIRFANGTTAQLWSVAADEAQSFSDRFGRFVNAEVDVLLRIKSVQPGTAGGTITTDVVEYELRDRRSGTVISRNKVSQ